jgi:hypothetical protein|tara:strand:- start:152 stop:1135 length:984 start_codon:yes stop_codon:yes gene_type:complete
MKFFPLLVVSASAAAADAPPPPTGGQGDYQFRYIESKLKMPSEANVDNIHGLAVVSSTKEVIVTFQDKDRSDLCMASFKPSDNYTEGQSFAIGGDLCSGVPHGLRLIEEEGQQFLYHANNAQKLSKTSLDGEIVWQNVDLPPGMNSSSYSPTWMAADESDSPFVYLADGYGSSMIYVFTKDGKYTGESFGGVGTEHGQFQTSHSISWDWRENMHQMVVSDRENHRLEYFTIDPADPTVFKYESTAIIEGLQRPCNIRFNADGLGLIPDLEGPVIIVDENNKMISIVNVTDMLGDAGFLHPHDAHWLDNGDFIVVTWDPGEIGYFEKI